MGGFGSGRWHRAHTKGLTSTCDRLDVLALYRAGHLAPGGDCDRLGGVLLAGFTEDGTLDRSDLYLVPIEWTACRYGGRRPWFRCPGVACDARVRILYRPWRSRYFACRHCYGLVYASQHADAFGRARERGMKIRRRLGGQHIIDPFPDRPRHMHWETYLRLWQRAERAELEALAHMGAGIDKMQAAVMRSPVGPADRPRRKMTRRAQRPVSKNGRPTGARNAEFGAERRGAAS